MAENASVAEGKSEEGEHVNVRREKAAAAATLNTEEEREEAEAV